jgi:TonB family protein
VLTRLRRPLSATLAVTALLLAILSGAAEASDDFPYAWYLAAVHRKVTERWEGRALQGRQPVVTFEIARDGQVSNVAVKESSGNAYYDRTAMRAIAEAAPFPRLPDEFPGASLAVSMSFDYAVDRGGGAVRPVPTEADAAECARRKAASASIAAGKLATAEKQLAALQPVVPGACPEELAVDALRSRLRAAEEHERLRQAEERRRQDITARPWPENIKRAALAKRVEIGMTSEQVTAAWGRPLNVEETITATSRQEEWIYPGPTVLYFMNGALTKIHRRR